MTEWTCGTFAFPPLYRGHQLKAVTVQYIVSPCSPKKWNDPQQRLSHCRDIVAFLEFLHFPHTHITKLSWQFGMGSIFSTRNRRLIGLVQIICPQWKKPSWGGRKCLQPRNIPGSLWLRQTHAAGRFTNVACTNVTCKLLATVSSLPLCSFRWPAWRFRLVC